MVKTNKQKKTKKQTKYEINKKKTYNKNNIFSHKNVKGLKQSIKNTTLRDIYSPQKICKNRNITQI